MDVLHAAWSLKEGLLVWGEDEAPEASVVRRSRSTAPTGRKAEASAARSVPRHPFAASAESIRAVLCGLEAPGVVDAGTAWATLRLPSAAGRPLASGLRLGGHRPVPEAAALRPWRVPCLVFHAAWAVDLLLALDRSDPAGFVLAPTFPAFTAMVRLALEWMARGRVLPDLVRKEGAWHALWRPAPSGGEDVGRLRALATALPAAGAAAIRVDDEATVTGDGTPAGGTPSAMLVVRDAIDGFVDGCTSQLVPLEPDLAARRTRAPAREARRAQATEAWLRALFTQASEVRAPEADLVDLKTRIDAWSAPLVAEERRPFRTCFRLSGPGAETTAGGTDAGWRLDLLLQDPDDPSLLASLDQVWRTGGRALELFHVAVPDPQERVLADLGRAARVWPGLARALRTSRPSGMDLSTDDAWHFLAEAAPLLEGAGYGVLVPPWWRKREVRLGLRLRVREEGGRHSSGLVGTDGICAFDASLCLGDEVVSPAELARLARAKTPLVRLRGRWVELRPEDVERALAAFRHGPPAGETTVAGLLRLALGLDPANAGLPVGRVEAEGALGALLRGDADLAPVPVPAPEGFHGTLRPYQERGLAWLRFLEDLGLGACLADDMGLGKTIQVLALLVSERAGRSGDGRPGPTLLVCPMSVLGNWQQEAARFAPDLEVHVHHGSGRLAGDALRRAVTASDLVLTTYAVVPRDRADLSAIRWHRVVLDEAQNVKTSGARQTQAVRELQAARRVALTGTPVENRLAELWSILHFLNPGLLGSAADFQRRFVLPVERNRDRERAALLRRLVGPFVLRRLKTDPRIIQDLPDKIEVKVSCPLTREQASLYQAVVDDMLARIDQSEGIERKGLVLATLLKLKQVCNHPAQFLQDGSRMDGRSGKVARLEEILDEVLASGDRALLFTQFAEMGRLLAVHLQDRFHREVLYLHGTVQKKARDAMVARFQSPDGPPLLLLSLKAGGTGLNLTAASHVVHFDRWWNPAVEDQATDRAFRIGQRRNVQVHKFVCQGTVEERIDRMIEEKRALAHEVVGSGEGWLTELSTTALRDVVALSASALAEA